MKLLAVDDSSVIRKVIIATADVLQIETIEACDGVEALEKLSEYYDEIDLILLDWNMPEMNGYDVLVAIKTSDIYKHIPVMMVTTEGQQSSIVAAVRAGANNYLVKPFTVEELETKIVECLGKGGNF
ncbi:MAG: response regulator [Defluviitaleaceae bacterium]|nr:response regulator [Defluviitaleaceae bacterium]